MYFPFLRSNSKLRRTVTHFWGLAIENDKDENESGSLPSVYFSMTCLVLSCCAKTMLGGKKTKTQSERAYDETPSHFAGGYGLFVGRRAPVILDPNNSKRLGRRVAEQVHTFKEQRHGRVPGGVGRGGSSTG